LKLEEEVQDDLKLPSGSGEVLVSVWSGW
jgi:hypothetical protein